MYIAAMANVTSFEKKELQALNVSTRSARGPPRPTRQRVSDTDTARNPDAVRQFEYDADGILRPARVHRIWDSDGDDMDDFD